VMVCAEAAAIHTSPAATSEGKQTKGRILKYRRLPR
jgi:hypothetical protein